MTLLFQIYYYRAFYSSDEARTSVDGTSSSERTPLLNDPESPAPAPAQPPRHKPTRRRQIIEMALLWAFVVAFGVGAFLYDRNHARRPSPQPDVPVDTGDIFEWKSQVLGWFSAALYLGSRIPQISESSYALKLMPDSCLISSYTRRKER